MTDNEPLEGHQLKGADAEMAGHYTKYDATEAPPPTQEREELTPRVTGYLSDRRDEYAEEYGEDGTIDEARLLADVIQLTIAERQDLSDMRGESPEKDRLLTIKRDELNKLSAKVVDAATGTDKGNQETLIAIINYFIEKFKDDHEHGGDYQEILTRYLRSLPIEQLTQTEEPPEDIERTDELQEQQEVVVGIETQPAEVKERDGEQSQLPEYHYSPDEHLITFFAENEERPVTLETLTEFVTAARDDLQDQSKRFETEHTELIAAVDMADTFSIAHRTERDSGGLILVGEREGEPVVGWEHDLTDITGTTYSFNPQVFSESPTLSDYVYNRRQFIYRLDGIKERKKEGANQAVKRVKLLPAQKMTARELAPIYEVIKRHEDGIEEGFKEIYLRHDGIPEAKMKEAILNDPESAQKTASLLNQREMMIALRELVDEREKPTGLGRFSRGGKRLRN